MTNEIINRTRASTFRINKGEDLSHYHLKFMKVGYMHQGNFTKLFYKKYGLSSKELLNQMSKITNLR